MSSHAELHLALDGDVPEGLDALSDEEARQLAQAIVAARAHQAQALRVAIDAALGHVPFVLRGALRKILGV